jgi:hypothetical protein
VRGKIFTKPKEGCIMENGEFQIREAGEEDLVGLLTLYEQ